MKRIKKLIEFLKSRTYYRMLISELQRRMVEVKETMALEEVTEVYAKYVCRMNNWCIDVYAEREKKWGLSKEFCEIGFSFMNGYIKALHDNGLMFKNGMVTKRPITNEFPLGVWEEYEKDAKREMKAKAIESLREVLGKYETSKENINVIVSSFEERIKRL